MENELLMAAGYGLARLSILALFGYAVYRVLSASPKRVPVRARVRNAQERLQGSRNPR